MTRWRWLSAFFVLLISTNCSRIIDLGSNTVCVATPAACFLPESTCEYPVPSQSVPFEPADSTTSVLTGFQAGPSSAAVGRGSTMIAWERSACSVFPQQRECSVLTAQVAHDGSVGRASSVKCEPGTMLDPAVAWNGKVFLVVGRVVRANLAADLYAARFAEDGRPLDTHCSQLSSGTQVSWPAVTALKDDFVVVWTDQSQLLGARIDSGGAVMQFPAPISVAAHGFSTPAVAANGTTLMVAWFQANTDTQGRLLAVPIDLQGAPTTAPVVIAEPKYNFAPAPAIDSDGDTFMVLWSDYRETVAGAPSATVVSSRIWAMRVGADGRTFDPPGGRKVSSKSFDNSGQLFVRSVFDGSAYQVAWYDASASGVTGTRLARDGTPLMADTTLVANADFGHVLVMAQGVSQLYFSQEHEIWRVTLRDGVVDESSRLRVSRGLNSQESPHVTITHSQWLVIWSEQHLDELNQLVATTPLLGRRLAPSTSPIDPEPFVLSSNALKVEVDVASDGINHLAVWQEAAPGVDDVNVLTSLVPGDGVSAPSQPRTIATLTSMARPSLCFDGREWRLWLLTRVGGLYAQRLAPDGSPLETPQPISNRVKGFQLAHESCIGVAIIDDALVRVERTDAQTYFQPIDNVVAPGRRFVADGTASRLFVMWEQSVDGVLSVGWRVLDESGNIVGRGSAEPLFFWNSAVVATATPEGFLVFGVVTGRSSQAQLVRLARFSLDGVKLGPVVELTQSATWLDAAAAATGPVALVSTDFDDEREAVRLSVVQLQWRSLGESCTTDSQCASSSCGHAN